jgi:selenide, water dikinase
VLSEILKGTAAMPIPPQLLVGIETADDAAVYQLNDEQALIATTDFFMPIVDDPSTSAASPPPTRSATSTRWAARRSWRWRWWACRSPCCPRRPSAACSKAATRCAATAGIPIAGGHTIDSVEAIYGLVALGLVHPKRSSAMPTRGPATVLVLGKPLGVGVMSAALKKGEARRRRLRADDRQHHEAQHPGPALAALPGVHALTDVTGFGLAGHALELARARLPRWHRLGQGAAADGVRGSWSGLRHRRLGPQLGRLRPTMSLPAGFAPRTGPC